MPFRPVRFLRYFFKPLLSIPAFLFLFFTTLYFASSVGRMNSQDGSHLALTMSLAEDHSVELTRYFYLTARTDYIIVNGKKYSDRDPGLSYLAVPFYNYAKMTAAFGTFPYPTPHKGITKDSIVEVFTFLISNALAGWTTVIFYLLSVRLGNSKKSSVIASLLVGSGTLLWKNGGSFYRESAGVSFLLSGLYYFLISQNKKAGPIYFILTGLSIGLAVFCNYQLIYIPLLLLIFGLFARIFSVTKWLGYLVGISIPAFLIISYNIMVFGKPIANPHNYNAVSTWMNRLDYIFTTPLTKSVLTNLFNFKTIDPSLFTFLDTHPEIAKDIGASYAKKYPYKGIFTQSPILFFAAVGFLGLFLKNRRFCIFVSFIIFIELIINSKLTQFWAPNQYDTRYFLLATILILLGLANWIDWMMHISSRTVRTHLIFLFILASAISIYFAWYSLISHFGPNITGEHRYNPTGDFNLLLTKNGQYFAIQNILINTFPNYVNIPTLIIFYFLPLAEVILLLALLNHQLTILLMKKSLPRSTISPHDKRTKKR